jgi:methylated-DNA-protein-cysteine methyltransferase-like protein
VGYALHALPRGSSVPWHRIVNASGAISLRRSDGAISQRLLLDGEGVQFDVRQRVSLATYAWRPRTSR